MRRYELMIGLASDIDSEQLTPEQYDLRATDALACLEINGIGEYTSWRTDGAYKGVREPSLVVVLFGTAEDAVRRAVSAICGALHQECVLVSVTEPDLDFWGL